MRNLLSNACGWNLTNYQFYLVQCPLQKKNNLFLKRISKFWTRKMSNFANFFLNIYYIISCSLIPQESTSNVWTFRIEKSLKKHRARKIIAQKHRVRKIILYRVKKRRMKISRKKNNRIKIIARKIILYRAKKEKKNSNANKRLFL